MSTATTSTLLRFRGQPHGVECIAPIDLGTNPNEKPSGDLFLELPEVSATALRVFRLSPGLARLWFSLPSYTPPGSYGGSAKIGGSDFRVAVDVDPNENLVLSPPELKIVATRSEKITTVLTLANAGNVVCDIRNTHAFGLFDVEGAERAVGAALRDSAVKGREKMDRLMDRFAEEHAGFVRVLIEEGSGPIAPGEVHELRVNLRFPDNMNAGRTYTGTWVLFNLAYQVRVRAEVEEQSRPTDTRHRESKKKDVNDKHNH
jgi:hypothetical protein